MRYIVHRIIGFMRWLWVIRPLIFRVCPKPSPKCFLRFRLGGPHTNKILEYGTFALLVVVVSAMAMVVVLPGYLRRLPRRCSTLGIDLFVRKDLAEILCCFKPTIDSRTCTISASDMEDR